MSKSKTGSNAQFTSAGKGLTVIGDHCYAYSGDIEATTASQTALEFATGKGYILGEFTFNGFIQIDNVSIRQGSVSYVFNNVVVSNQITADANEDSPADVKQGKAILNSRA